jgi:hypothetical protein
MSKVLIIFEDNWADEMDIKGSRIMSRKDWEQYISIAEQCFNDLEKYNAKGDEDGNPIEYSIEKTKSYWDNNNSISFWIGSNEEIEYENFEEFRRCFKVYDLAEVEADILTKFSFDDFGFFPDWIFDEWASLNNIEF